MTYNVPTVLLVLASIWLLPKILPVPKSEILGFISSSNKKLLAFKSLWMILSRESSWRYRSPLAMPPIMAARLAQSSCFVFVGSVFCQNSMKIFNWDLQKKKNVNQKSKNKINKWTINHTRFKVSYESMTLVLCPCEVFSWGEKTWIIGQWCHSSQESYNSSVERRRGNKPNKKASRLVLAMYS